MAERELKSADKPGVTGRTGRACRHLRAKTYYYQADGAELAASAIGSYWCLRTQRPDGPDRDLVEPKSCQPGRICYEEE